MIAGQNVAAIPDQPKITNQKIVRPGTARATVSERQRATAASPSAGKGLATADDKPCGTSSPVPDLGHGHREKASRSPPRSADGRLLPGRSSPDVGICGFGLVLVVATATLGPQ